MAYKIKRTNGMFFAGYADGAAHSLPVFEDVGLTYTDVEEANEDVAQLTYLGFQVELVEA